jgi:hypothetical protein
MTRRRVLRLVHKTLVPPADVRGLSKSRLDELAVEKAVLDRGVIALCSSSKHWAIVEFWGLTS